MRKTTSKIHFEVKKSKMQNRIIYGSLLSDGCDVYSRVCLCLENTGQEETLLMRLPWEGALETPLDFPPGGMRYFCNLKNQFGECWVFGWGEALILLPVGGVAFRGGSPGRVSRRRQGGIWGDRLVLWGQLLLRLWGPRSGQGGALQGL